MTISILEGLFRRGDSTTGPRGITVEGDRELMTNYSFKESGLPRMIGLRPMRRGFLSSPIGGTGKAVRLHFMYNPEVINFSYSFDETLQATDLAPGDEEIKSIATGGEISFEMFFDRTLELQAGESVNRSDIAAPGKVGVLHDIAVFEHLVGRVSGETGVASDEGNGSSGGFGGFGGFAARVQNWNEMGGDTDSIAAEGYAGILTSVETRANFGYSENTPYGLEFSGWIVGASILLTMFNADMIPSRCTIAISMKQMMSTSYPQTSTTTTAAAPLVDIYGVPIGISSLDVATLPGVGGNPNTPQSPAVLRQNPTGNGVTVGVTNFNVIALRQVAGQQAPTLANALEAPRQNSGRTT